MIYGSEYLYTNLTVVGYYQLRTSNNIAHKNAQGVPKYNAEGKLSVRLYIDSHNKQHKDNKTVGGQIVRKITLSR